MNTNSSDTINAAAERYGIDPEQLRDALNGELDLPDDVLDALQLALETMGRFDTALGEDTE